MKLTPQDFYYNENSKITCLLRPFWYRLFYIFPRDILCGLFTYHTPWCCVWYYSLLALAGVPVAMYEEILRHKQVGDGRIYCDKCVPPNPTNP